MPVYLNQLFRSISISFLFYTMLGPASSVFAQDAASLVSPHVADTTVVAWVNGLPLEAKWLRDEMQYDRHLVMSKYAKKHGRNTIYQKGFWDRAFHADSITPMDELREITFQRLCSLKIEQFILKEYKLIKDTRYTSLIERMEKINKQRKQAKKNGQIIYGPVTYTPKIYYQYYYRNKEIELKQKLFKEAKPKEQELKKLYLKYLYHYNLPELKVHVITVMNQEESVKKQLDQKQLSSESWEDIVSQVNSRFGKEVCQFSEVAYGYANARLAGPGHAGYEAVRNRVGDILEWDENEEGRPRRIKVIEKEDHYTPYAEARASVVSQYANGLYKRLLEQKVEDMIVKRTEAFGKIKL